MNPWYSWLYHYGVGGLLFATSLVVLLRSGALHPRWPRHRRLMMSVIGGLTLFATVHAVWILLATR